MEAHMFKLKEEVRKKVLYTVLSLVITTIIAILLLSCSRPLEIELSFNSNGGSDITSVILIEDEVFNLPSNPLRVGYTFNGWFLDDTLHTPFSVEAVLAVESSEPVLLFAKWQINSYTITFNSNEGSLVSELTCNYNDTITAPSVPMREGYTFDAWYVDQALSLKYTFDTMPAESVTLFAKWLVNPYTLSFNSNGGSNVSQVTYDFNETITAPSVPVRNGYTFDGWYTDEAFTTPYVFNTMPARNITLYAKWTINTSTITFDSNGGTSIAPLTQDFETVVQAPLEPSKTGHTFKGWYKDSTLNTAYTFPNTMTSEDITLYAKFEPNAYAINILSDGFVTFKQVVTGNSFSAGVSTSGDVYAWGFGSGGRLGSGTETNYLTPNKVNLPLLEGEKALSVYLTQLGGTVLTSLNRVFGWGGDSVFNLQINGQLNLSPVLIDLNLQESEVILDMLNTSDSTWMLALTNTRLLAWGRNTGGQVGLPARTSAPFEYQSVQEVPLSFLLPNETISKIYGSSSTTFLLTNLGNLYASGSFSAIGLNATTFTKVNIPILNANETIKDVIISLTYLVYLTTDNRILGIGKGIGDGTDTYYDTYQVINYNLLANESIVSFAGGFRSSSFLTNLGNIYTFGEGYASGSGITDNTTKVLSPVNITPRLGLDVDDSILSIASGNSAGLISTSKGFLIAYGSGFGSGTTSTSNLIVPTKAERIPGIANLMEPLSVLYNQTIVLPTPPVKPGFVFEGWYTDSTYTTPFTLDIMPAHSITIYAKYMGT